MSKQIAYFTCNNEIVAYIHFYNLLSQNMQVKTVHQDVGRSSEKTLTHITSMEDAENLHCRVFERKVKPSVALS